MKKLFFIVFFTGCVHPIKNESNSSVSFDDAWNCNNASDHIENQKCIWISEVREMIAKKWEYPLEAQRLSVEGVVELELVIDRGGNLLKSSITKSSDNRILDLNSISVVSSAAPFPIPSFEPQNKNFVISIEQRYRLKQ